MQTFSRGTDRLRSDTLLSKGTSFSLILERFCSLYIPTYFLCCSKPYCTDELFCFKAILDYFEFFLPKVISPKMLYFVKKVCFFVFFCTFCWKSSKRACWADLYFSAKNAKHKLPIGISVFYHKKHHYFTPKLIQTKAFPIRQQRFQKVYYF